MEQLPEYPIEQTPEQIETAIEKLLETLHDYSEHYDKFPDLQEEWYNAEMEAEVGADREMAKTHLEHFIKILEARISGE